jgi:hypothetical protein
MSYYYGPTGERIEDESTTDSMVESTTDALCIDAEAPSKWHPEPGCTDAWNDYNSGEDCPHGVIGGMDLSRFNHTRCVDCGGRRRKFKRRLTGRHPVNHDRIKSAWTRDAA